jgi:hypothetical protein
MNLRYHLLWLAITAPLCALGMAWFDSHTNGEDFSGTRFFVLAGIYVVIGVLLFPLTRRLYAWLTTWLRKP